MVMYHRLSLFFSAPKHLLKFNLNLKPTFSFIPHSRTSTSYFSSYSTQTIEHIVLLKVKDDTEPSKVNAMVNGLRSFKSIEQILHITAGPLLRNRSTTLNFTHMLYCRYGSKDDLKAYSRHPHHISVAKESVLPICEDVMAVDWVAEDLQGPISSFPGSALRVTLLKLKEDLEEEKTTEIVGALKGIKNSFIGQITRLTCGENFSPRRAKGYSIGSIAVFPGLSELDAMDSNEELVKLHEEKVKEYLESVVVVDYLVSLPQSASL
ncbi:stress-response A/B barrel domain-containing protein UP3-like [Humulus lupulus]|uniref:stress-response A/B barrel domain-containing protein UP3-like n=1 Tax=Humulus lupulus TaxID=3486 RepID=UPI002B4177DC|nr:stress-response A/B barrel domain-containing protein UP3-like [Humulus lupulus]